MQKADTPNNMIFAVLGMQLSLDGKMQPDLMKRLDIAAECYFKNKNSKILVVGKYAINYDWQNIIPKVYECDVMKEYLINLGIPPKRIIKESRSKDTIGNIYYINQYIKAHPKFKQISIICSEHHNQRVRLLCDKLIGNRATVVILPVTPTSVTNTVKTELLEIQKLFNKNSILADVTEDDDSSLKHKLYKSTYYKIPHYIKSSV